MSFNCMLSWRPSTLGMAPFVVAISGPSSSGKSTVIQGLQQVLPNTTVVHLDDFYVPDSQIPVDEELGIQNWDCAAAIDWGKFKTYLNAIKAGECAAAPTSLEIKSEMCLSEEQVQRLRPTASVVEQHIVLVDGFMLFHDDAIASMFDALLFFQAPYQVLKARREARAGYKTCDGFWSDPPGYFDEIVWPEYVRSHRHLIEGTGLSCHARNLGLVSIDGTGDLADLVEDCTNSIIASLANARLKQPESA